MPARTPLFRKLRQLLANGLSETPDWAQRPSRRRFLQTAIAGIGAAAAWRSADLQAAPKGPIGIVGGGVAGLTAAYRLQQKGVPSEVFEASPRLGGRMFTKRNFNRDDMFVELGGELIDTGHTAIIDLAKELGLELQNLLQGEKGHDVLWFEGRNRSEEELLSGLKPIIARVAQDASKLYDSDGGFTHFARQLDGISLSGYLAEIPGAESWVVQFLLSAYEPEYGLAAARISCLNLVDFTDTDLSDGFSVFGESDEAWRIQGGSGRLPEVLSEKLREGTALHTGKKLESIALGPDGILLGIQGEAAPREFAKVILTLPFTQLRKVRGLAELPLSKEKAKAIRELGYGQNVKVMRGFTSRTWREQHGNGSAFADLPSFQNIWETSRGQEGESGIITNLLGGRRSAEFRSPADERDLKDIEAVFPGAAAAYDGNNAVMNWPKIPTHEASYSCPLPGQYTWILEAAAAPECGGRLLFAGEHTSIDSCGFMNGGVDSGNRAAAEALG